MYFVRRSPEEVEEQCPIDLAPHCGAFHFGRFVYGDKLADCLKMIEDPRQRALIADIAGAAVAALFKTQHLEKVTTYHALDCCRDLIDRSGFEESSDADVRGRLFAPGTASNLIMVAGCQNLAMLTRRVDAAAKFVANFHLNFSVVFSGRNPAGSRETSVRIRNESRRMLNMFEERLRRLYKGIEQPKMQELALENESSTTLTNVAKLFGKDFFDSSKPTNLIVVSSTFHLIRLGAAINEFLRSNEDLTGNVRNVVLVGAESTEQLFYAEDDEYVKLMMFDIFNALLALQSPWGAVSCS